MTDSTEDQELEYTNSGLDEELAEVYQFVYKNLIPLVEQSLEAKVTGIIEEHYSEYQELLNRINKLDDSGQTNSRAKDMIETVAFMEIIKLANNGVRFDTPRPLH